MGFYPKCRVSLKMKKLILLTSIFFLMSCGKIINSSTDNVAIYRPPFIASGAYGEVQKLLIQHCTICHNHSYWSQLTEQDFIALGLVTARNPTNSRLYYRNINSPVQGAEPSNMPGNGYPSISPANLVIIADWINTL